MRTVPRLRARGLACLLGSAALCSAYRATAPTGRRLAASVFKLKMDASTAGFSAWAASADIAMPKATHKVFEQPGGARRGLAATERIAAGECVVSLPLESAALCAAAGEAFPFSDWLGAGAARWWKDAPLQMRLALRVLHEAKHIGVDRSAYSGYLKLLPPIGDPAFTVMPLHWTDDELARLSYPGMEAAVRSQRASWAAAHAALAAAGGAAVSLEDWQWAMQCVTSRAFGGQWSGGGAVRSLILTQAAVWIAGGAAAFASAKASPGGEVDDFVLLFTVAAAAAAALPVTLSELRSASPAAEVVAMIGAVPLGAEGAFRVSEERRSAETAAGEVCVLAPGIDSMNHDQGCASSLALNPATRRLEACVGREAAPGEELFISYGPRGADELLQYFGFSRPEPPTGSPDAHAVVGAAALEAVVGGARRERLEGELPGALAAAARLLIGKEGLCGAGGSGGAERVAAADAAALLRLLVCEDAELRERLPAAPRDLAAALRPFREPLLPAGERKVIEAPMAMAAEELRRLEGAQRACAEAEGAVAALQEQFLERRVALLRRALQAMEKQLGAAALSV